VTESESDDSSDGLEDLLTRALDLSSPSTETINVEDNSLIAWENERSRTSRSIIGTLSTPEISQMPLKLSDSVSALARHALGETERTLETGVYGDAFGTYVRWLLSRIDKPLKLTQDDVLLNPPPLGRIVSNLSEAQVFIASYSVYVPLRATYQSFCISYCFAKSEVCLLSPRVISSR
jgi:hypothetical protein